MWKPKILVGSLLVLVGLIVISVPLLYEWQKNKEVIAMERALDMIEGNNNDTADLSSIKHLTVSEEELNNVMELEIPSIDLIEKVLPVTSEENLSIALTQIKPHQVPGQGNFAIAGHRGYRGDRLFRKLPEVLKGDKVLLRHGNETYTYQIVRSAIIEPNEVDVLKDQQKNEITLITCTLDGKQRFVLNGIRIDAKKGKSM
ncbi:class D sortase [Bacillus sp. NPDC077027]|uniref:class D sortase n=1 Tax=Bacillus sp. NPDC077027 TaxID=3390548 RepID=UPI003CFDFFB4